MKISLMIYNESLRGKADYPKSNIFLNCDQSFGNRSS